MRHKGEPAFYFKLSEGKCCVLGDWESCLFPCECLLEIEKFLRVQSSLEISAPEDVKRKSRKKSVLSTMCVKTHPLQTEHPNLRPQTLE